MEQIFLPNEVLTRIISYLGVGDVRSCRLVCRRWRSCCEDRIITRAEKFIFHSATHFTSEINEFLMNLERGRVNVQLNRINLKELNFEAFGKKIEELEIRNCLVDRDTLVNLFYVTLNMTRLQIHFIVHDCPRPELTSDKLDFEIWNTVINLLHEQQFQNFNLKDFDCNLYDLAHRYPPTCKPDEKFLPHVFSIFPCVQNINFGPFHWSTFDNLMMKNILPNANFTNFGGIFTIDFNREDQLWTIPSLFPRLKSLRLEIDLKVRKFSYLSLCERFFSLLPELEVLDLKCKDRNWPHYCAEMIKALLFQILKSCLKLSKLELKVECLEGKPDEIRLNRDEIQEFSFLIRKIKSLRLPEIFVELDSGATMVTLPNTDGLLEDLSIKVVFTRPFDVRYIIMKTYQLTILYLNDVEFGASFINFEDILLTQKCLQHLTIITTMHYSDITVLQMSTNKVIQLKHERLNHFHYKIHTTDENYIVERLCLWEFPNLLHLYLSTSAVGYNSRPHWFKATTPGLEDIFKEWIGRMKTLTQISVDVFAGLLNCEAFGQVCGKLPHLQSVIWTGHRYCEARREDIVNLFNNLPNLRSMSFRPMFPKRYEKYHYSRSKKQLFEVRDRSISGLDLIIVDYL